MKQQDNVQKPRDDKRQTEAADTACEPASPATKDADHYVIRVVDDPAAIDAQEWNALLAASPSATPFMRHEYLAAMAASGSASADAGWQAQFLAVFDDGVIDDTRPGLPGHPPRGSPPGLGRPGDRQRLVAACPLYLKDHSYGEYVFDWAWADAYRRNGLRYYPKLLAAVPFTPVPGPRLLARDAPARRMLLRAMQQVAVDAKLSSAHVLFLDADDQAAARAEGWMMRSTVQFHWTQRTPEPYRDFADFLSCLQREKRKKIQQERRRVIEAGIGFETLAGAAITAKDWDFFYRCYCQTYREHGGTPYLTRDFFARMSASMAEHWLLFIAVKQGRRIAASLICIDPMQGHAFGRYWGAVEHVPCLHFEACYYLPLAWCIANGYRRFEGGAQGEHKMARGLLPVQTWSAHWLAHPQFAQAVSDFLAREGAGVADYIDDLNERQPFKSAG